MLLWLHTHHIKERRQAGRFPGMVKGGTSWAKFTTPSPPDKKVSISTDLYYTYFAAANDLHRDTHVYKLWTQEKWMKARNYHPLPDWPGPKKHEILYRLGVDWSCPLSGKTGGFCACTYSYKQEIAVRKGHPWCPVFCLDSSQSGPIPQHPRRKWLPGSQSIRHHVHSQDVVVEPGFFLLVETPGFSAKKCWYCMRAWLKLPNFHQLKNLENTGRRGVLPIQNYLLWGDRT